MKKILFTLCGVALVATAVYAASTQIKNTAAGYLIGTTADQLVGFFGATPVAQQSVPAAGATATILSNQLKAATTQATLTVNSATLTYVASVDSGTGIMATISVVTNASINTVFGFASSTAGAATNEIVGTVAPASATNAVKALRNLGLGN